MVTMSLVATTFIGVVTIHIFDVTIEIVATTILVCWGYISETFVEATK